MIARSPADFTDSGRFVEHNWNKLINSFEMTNAGLRLDTYLIQLKGERYAAVLNCRYMTSATAVGLQLRKDHAARIAGGQDRYYIDENFYACDTCRSDSEHSAVPGSYIRCNRLAEVDIDDFHGTEKMTITIITNRKQPAEEIAGWVEIVPIWVRLDFNTPFEITSAWHSDFGHGGFQSEGSKQTRESSLAGRSLKSGLQKGN